MKKIIILLLLPALLFKPAPTRAYGVDAAALIAFMGPYLGALEALSAATGMDMSDLKDLTQETMRITSDLARVYNAGTRMAKVSARTMDIYTEYLETLQYIYENSTFIDESTASYHAAVLNKAVFGQADSQGKFAVDQVMDGAMGDIKDLLSNMERGANTSLTEMATYLDNIRHQMDNTLGSIRSYKSYLRCAVSRKQHQLGIYEIDTYLKNKKKY